MAFSQGSSPFAGIKTAEVYGSGQYFQPMPRPTGPDGRPLPGDAGCGSAATYDIEVLKLELQKSKDPKKKGAWFFILEGFVHWSNHPTITPGQTRNWMTNLSQPSGLSNVKALVMALVPGITEDDITEQQMLMLVGQHSSLFEEDGTTPKEGADLNPVGRKGGDDPAPGLTVRTVCWHKVVDPVKNAADPDKGLFTVHRWESLELDVDLGNLPTAS